MRYFKNEPTKLTLGTHSYTPTQETFFKSSNRESYGVSRKHSYVPPTPTSSSSSTTNKSSRYLDNISRKHNYVPPIGNTNKNTNNHGARTFPNNKNKNVIPPKVDIDKEMEAALLRERQEQERREREGQEKVRQEQARREKEQQEKDRHDKEQQEREKQKRIQQDEAARKLQAFVRGAMCRVRVSNMLLQLIEGLLADKERRQRQLQEEKEQELEQEEVVEPPRSQQFVFAALDDNVSEREERKHDVDVVVVLEQKSVSILKSPKRETNSVQKDGQSICFVDSKNQVRKIERVLEYVRLPEWWMEYAPHGTLPDNEIDDEFAVVSPSQWEDEEKKVEEGDISAAYAAAINVVRPVPDQELEIGEEKKVDEDEFKEKTNHDTFQEEEQVHEEEIVEVDESLMEEEVIEEDELDEPGQEAQPAAPEPENIHVPTTKSPPVSIPRIPSLVPSQNVYYEKPTDAVTTETVDPSTMSLAERMKHFQKNSQAPVKKNFRATTFR